MTLRGTEVLRDAMSNRSLSIASRALHRSADAFPNASLSASNDCSTVDSSFTLAGMTKPSTDDLQQDTCRRGAKSARKARALRRAWRGIVLLRRCYDFVLRASRNRSPSSRGLGRGPFKAKTRVRIPVGTLTL